MRFKNSLRNLSVSFLAQIFIMGLSFVSRTIFVRLLATEYLGLSGLFTNILSVLALSELGIGNAIIVNLYKPVADHDEKAISRYMNFYATAYRIIGIGIFVFGVVSTPFLPYLVNTDTEIPHLALIYFLYVANTAVSYFCAYKRTILTVYQKEYISRINPNLFALIQNILQIVVLLFTGNYILYVLMMTLCTLASNLCISVVADRMYPFLRENRGERLGKPDILDLFRSLKAILYYKLGNTAVNSTDNILISTLLGVYFVGLYSNYSMIVGVITTFTVMVFAACSASLGNYNACESDQNVYFLFRVMSLLSFWIYGFASICFICLFQPFITLWIGEQYLLGNGTMLLIVAAFFLKGLISVSGTFLDVSKLFIRTRMVPVLMAVINLAVSIVAAKITGLSGIFIGTIVSYAATQLWVNPYVLCKYRFHVQFSDWICFFFSRLAVVFTALCVTYIFVQMTNYFILKLVLCLIIPNGWFCLFQMWTKEFCYIVSKVAGILRRTGE